MPRQLDPTDDSVAGRRRSSPFSVEHGSRDDEDDDNDNEDGESTAAVAVAVNGPLLLLDESNPQDGTTVVGDDDGIETNTTSTKNKKKVFPASSSPPTPPIPRSHDPTTRPAGERERFEAGRGMRSSQMHIIQERRKSFIVEFSAMKGPPQITIL